MTQACPVLLEIEDEATPQERENLALISVHPERPDFERQADSLVQARWLSASLQA